LEDLELEIHCPHCDSGMNVMLSQIAREETVKCRACKKPIHMKPDPKPSQEEKIRVIKSLEDINLAVKKITDDPVKSEPGRNMEPGM
jgi:predicted Zn finger-like uncharacterized protein